MEIGKVCLGLAELYDDHHGMSTSGGVNHATISLGQVLRGYPYQDVSYDSAKPFSHWPTDTAETNRESTRNAQGDDAVAQSGTSRDFHRESAQSERPSAVFSGR